MKNCLVLILFATLFSVRVTAQETDLQRAGLKGVVKSVRIFDNETAKDGNEKWQLKSTQLYNGSGMLSGKVLYAPGNEEEATSNYSYYYNDGYLWKIEYSSNFKLITTVIYKYNNQNKVAEIATKQITPDELGLNGSDKTETFTYDAKGNCTEDKSFFPGYKSTTIFRYTYDKANRKTRLEQEKDGRLYGITEYEYDKKNQLIKETSKAADDITVYEITSYEYDTEGHIIHEVLKNKDGKIYRNKTVKYNRGMESEQTTEEDGKTNKYTTEYTFDKAGNWTRQKNFKNGVKYFDTEREIGYY